MISKLSKKRRQNQPKIAAAGTDVEDGKKFLTKGRKGGNLRKLSARTGAERSRKG